MNNTNNTLQVMVYSNNWTHKVAIEYAYSSINQASAIIQGTRDMDVFIRHAIDAKPNLIVIDDAPRNAVALILTLRQQCRDAVIIFMQEAFLFSDKIVREYFDGIVLKNYDALVNEAPSLLLAEYHCLLCGLKEKEDLTSLPPWRVQGVSEALQSIKQLMYVRFSHLIASPRGQEVVLGWLIKGIEPITAGRLLGCSGKVVYHYRLMAMKVLGIQRTRDFIASLTVTAGPVSYCQWGTHRPTVARCSLPALSSCEQVKVKGGNIEKSALVNTQESGACSVTV